MSGDEHYCMYSRAYWDTREVADKSVVHDATKKFGNNPKSPF